MTKPLTTKQLKAMDRSQLYAVYRDETQPPNVRSCALESWWVLRKNNLSTPGPGAVWSNGRLKSVEPSRWGPSLAPQIALFVWELQIITEAVDAWFTGEPDAGEVVGLLSKLKAYQAELEGLQLKGPDL